MPIKYAKKDKSELIYDSPKDAIHIFDVDKNGLFNLSPIASKFKKEFPFTYKLYEYNCIEGKLDVGDISLHNESSTKIILFCTTDKRLKYNNREVFDATIFCIDQMAELVDKNNLFVSGILNRHTQTWDKIYNTIKNSNLTWEIYRE